MRREVDLCIRIPVREDFRVTKIVMKKNYEYIILIILLNNYSISLLLYCRCRAVTDYLR